MIVPTDGSHIVCPTCDGTRVETQPVRVMLRRHPGLHTIGTDRPCRSCEATGWLPPRHPVDPAPDEDEDDM
ncbi:hypothetical protein LO762_06045 [Actinocorallia sp. API 0066]|uniref:hypothetical protein n=1 Tax=Actinocorallia sp. API 0066 TaxID=2896846 RepID=UPI001E2DCD1F|nr:hypothetical protein [Actinocorallia sp. API 0066]MCD0448758.1 hypothetical protein [Actinocorallia sp. API 0066]